MAPEGGGLRRMAAVVGRRDGGDVEACSISAANPCPHPPHARVRKQKSERSSGTAMNKPQITQIDAHIK